MFFFSVQIENLLISSKGYLKLCDFGSATTEAHYPDNSWTAIRRSLVEDEVCDHNFRHKLLNILLRNQYNQWRHRPLNVKEPELGHILTVYFY